MPAVAPSSPKVQPTTPRLDKSYYLLNRFLSEIVKEANISDCSSALANNIKPKKNGSPTKLNEISSTFELTRHPSLVAESNMKRSMCHKSELNISPNDPTASEGYMTSHSSSQHDDSPYAWEATDKEIGNSAIPPSGLQDNGQKNTNQMNSFSLKNVNCNASLVKKVKNKPQSSSRVLISNSNSFDAHNITNFTETTQKNVTTINPQHVNIRINQNKNNLSIEDMKTDHFISQQRQPPSFDQHSSTLTESSFGARISVNSRFSRPIPNISSKSINLDNDDTSNTLDSTEYALDCYSSYSSDNSLAQNHQSTPVSPVLIDSNNKKQPLSIQSGKAEELYEDISPSESLDIDIDKSTTPKNTRVKTSSGFSNKSNQNSTSLGQLNSIKRNVRSLKILPVPSSPLDIKEINPTLPINPIPEIPQISTKGPIDDALKFLHESITQSSHSLSKNDSAIESLPKIGLAEYLTHYAKDYSILYNNIKQVGESTSPQPTLFASIHFILTRIVPTTADQTFSTNLRSNISQRGGKFVNSRPDSRRKITKHRNFARYILVTSQPQRTYKYFRALAQGVPCVHYQWVLNSLLYGSLQPLESYLLPAGYAEDGTLVEQPSWTIHEYLSDVAEDQKYAFAMRCDNILQETTLHQKTSKNSNLQEIHSSGLLNKCGSSTPYVKYIPDFDHARVEVVGTNTFKAMWRSILKDAGAVLVDRIGQGLSTRRIDYILTDSHPTYYLIAQAQQRRMPLCTQEWAIQSIICRSILDPYKNQAYHFLTN